MGSHSIKTTELSILFTANINGTLQNCDCGGEPLGGIGRIKTFIDDYRDKHPNTIVIDGGDYFNSYPFIELDTAMLKSLQLINYDIFVPGDQEFVEGKEFFSSIEASLGKRLFISNSNLKNNGERSFKFGESVVHIFSFLSPDAFIFINPIKKLKLSPFSALKKSKLHDLNIVVFHGRYADAERIVKDNIWIDLILLAHDQFEEVNKVSNTLIIGSGRNSEFITVIKGLREADTWKYDINKEKIKESIKEDENIVAIIQEYQKKVMDTVNN